MATPVSYIKMIKNQEIFFIRNKKINQEIFLFNVPKNLDTPTPHP